VTTAATATNERTPIEVHCGKCDHEWAIGFAPIPIDQFVKVGKSGCPACRSKDVLMGPLPKPTDEGNVGSWIHNGDTGISSETIWSVLLRRTIARSYWHPDVPHDPADFGRCYRLLKIMPSWRGRLPEVAAKYPAWKPLVDAWDELTALYEEELPRGTAPKLYKRMRQLRGEA
jgi:hypothetical protein